MRILLELEALNDQNIWDASEYHKVQGFVYDKLIANTKYRGMHDSNTYKFFCFSNIFPSTLVKSGQIRRLLFSSPNIDLVKSKSYPTQLLVRSVRWKNACYFARWIRKLI
ncbi:MAG: hypothetical protein WBP64_05575 [Nitrososphaeraceae archaeon]